MNQAIVPTEIDSVVDRAAFVLAQIDLLKRSVQTGFLALGAYLSEVKRFNYYRQVGFNDFKSFVESTFDFKERQSYFLMEINDKKAQLELPDELLLKHNLSCLKLIMAQEDQKIIELLHGGPYKVTDLKKMLAAPDMDKTEWCSLNIVMTRSQREVAKVAFELAAKKTGYTEKNSLFEVICADFISGDHTEEDYQDEE